MLLQPKLIKPDEKWDTTLSRGRGDLSFVEIQRFCGICPNTFETDCSHEIGTLEAVDSEILSDYDACLYADEPLAGEEWYARYLKKSAEHKQQNEMLQRR